MGKDIEMDARQTKRHLPTEARPSLPRRCKGVVAEEEVEREPLMECKGCGKKTPMRNSPYKRLFKNGPFRPLDPPTPAKVPAEDARDCTVCYNTRRCRKMLLLICNHSFHKTCILEWFKRNQTCPLCRK